MVNTKVSLLGGQELPPHTGRLNENPRFGFWVALALWFSESLNTQSGEAYATITGAIRHGLPTVTLPYVGGYIYGIPNPADRARVAKGTHRLSVYHRDHTGEVVNPALDYAYRNRLSTVALTTSLREVCGCGLEGCFIHPIEGTGGGKRIMGGSKGRRGGCVGIPTGEFEEDGSIATGYGNKYDSGITNMVGDRTFKTAIFGMVGGRVGVVAWRTCSKRAGMGAKGERDPSLVQYRYATSCDLCGKKTCWGCTPDSHLRWTTVRTDKGRLHGALDPRGEANGYGSIATVRESLEAQEGVAAVVVSDQPFESGYDGVFLGNEGWG